MTDLSFDSLVFLRNSIILLLIDGKNFTVLDPLRKPREIRFAPRLHVSQSPGLVRNVSLLSVLVDPQVVQTRVQVIPEAQWALVVGISLIDCEQRSGIEFAQISICLDPSLFDLLAECPSYSELTCDSLLSGSVSNALPAPE